MTLHKGCTPSFHIDVLACAIISILGYIALFVPPEQAANLPSVPDEGQYAISASNLFNKGTYSVTLNHKDYPGYYPYGFPLLLVPALYLWGPFVGNVTYANFFLNIAVLMFKLPTGQNDRWLGCRMYHRAIPVGKPPFPPFGSSHPYARSHRFLHGSGRHSPHKDTGEAGQSSPSRVFRSVGGSGRIPCLLYMPPGYASIWLW